MSDVTEKDEECSFSSVNNKDIPSYIRNYLYFEARFSCPFCNKLPPAILHIHHIIPFSKIKLHDKKLMIAACPNCHIKLDRNYWSVGVCLNIKKELKRSLYEYRPFFSINSPTLFSSLDREGDYKKLLKCLGSAIFFCKKNDKNNEPFKKYLPELTIERAKALRKVGKEEDAIKDIDSFLDANKNILSDSQKFSLILARGFTLFNKNILDESYKELIKCKQYFGGMSDVEIGSESSILEIEFRLAVIKSNKIDKIYHLAKESNYNFDIIPALLAEAIIKKKNVSNDWKQITEELLLQFQNRPYTIAAEGYEMHGLSELFYFAHQIFEPHKKALARQFFLFQNRYFQNIFSAKHADVYEIR